MKRPLARLGLAGLLLAAAGLTGCGSAPVGEHAVLQVPANPPPAAAAEPPAPPPAASAEDDGPPRPEEIPFNLAQTPDAVPKLEAKTPTGNPGSYSVFGKTYNVLDDARGFQEQGFASWYGRKFQGKRTSSGESYDMFKMTAAHRTLPIPCYVRVTNLRNNRSVVVRVNDRGPFRKDRVIDLSYTAALKLAILGGGSTPVRVEAVEPGEAAPPVLLASARPARKPAAAAPKPAPAPPAAPATAPAAPPAATLIAAAQPATRAAAPIPATVSATPAAAPTAPAAPPPPPTLVAAAQPLAPASTPLVLASAAAAAPVSAPAVAAAQAPPPAAAAVGEPLPIAAMSAIPAPAAPAGGPHFLQAGLFSDPVNAATMREQLYGMGIANVLLKSESRGAAFVHRVLIGPFTDAAALDLVRKRLSELQMPAVPVIN